MPEIVSPLEALDEVDEEAAYVVIDVYRFSTTVAALLHNGIPHIKPFQEVNDAMRWKRDSERVLIGEESGEPIDGFDYNNSPTALMAADLPTAMVGILTTNGTRALQVVEDAEDIFIGSTVNARAVADALPDDRDIVLLAVGTEGEETPEDVVGAELIERYYEDDPPSTRTLDSYRNRMKASPYAEHLRDLGFEADVAYACRFNELDEVPQLDDGVISSR